MGYLPEPLSSLKLGVEQGKGSTIFPALEENPELFFHCTDFSPRAIALVKADKRYDSTKIDAFVHDITESPAIDNLCRTVDVVSLLFILSALPVESHTQAVRNAISALKPGGHLVFRDYATGDTAQNRFESCTSEVPKLDHDNLYVRQDGTLSFFFDEEYIRGVVSDLGMTEIQLERKYMTTENRKREIRMERVFLHGIWRRDLAINIEKNIS